MPAPPTPDVHQLSRKLARDPDLTLLLDPDGTLIPFAPSAELAHPDRPTLRVLAALDKAGIRVVIVSGRPVALVEPLRAVIHNARWFAEHGAWRCEGNGQWVGPAPAVELDELACSLAPTAEVEGIRLERKSLSLAVHWRLVPFPVKEQMIAAVELLCDEWLESNPEFERIAGVEMLEVRRRSANKSAAVAWVRTHLAGARIIALGDDDTDEDMFAALHADELAIGVGPRARLRSACAISGPAAVREFLWWLVDTRISGDALPVPQLSQKPAADPGVQAALVVVSNRIPPATTGRRRSVGGLVSALEPALRTHEGVWLGWNGHESPGDRELLIDADARPIQASFDFAPGWREQFYDGFCNRALWPLFHGFPGRVRYADRDWLAYVEANVEFARHAHRLVAPDGLVWAHDYHLLLLARILRRRGFTGRIGLFLHIPFPTPDLFDTLPWADELLEAMLEFDLLGFHTEQWADSFRATVADRGGGHRMPDIGVLPIGVDPLRFAITETAIAAEVAGLQAALGRRRLILGVDRLDYAKGIPERLLAFERLLESRPEWHREVSFVQVSVPSREDVPEYAQLRHSVELLVGRINGRFGEADWVPVRYLYRSYDHDVLAQLYRAADVALVTPLRDGLNLVAKEYVVAQDPESPGMLVLSRFAGAAAELTDAVITNPYHPDGLADDIDRALRMSLDERKRRHTRMFAALANKTPQRWAAAFLDRLISTGTDRAEVRLEAG